MGRHLNGPALFVALAAGVGGSHTAATASQQASIEMPSPFAALEQSGREDGVRRLRFDPDAHGAFARAGDDGRPFRVTGLALPGRMANLELQRLDLTVPGFRAEIAGPRGSRFVEPRVRMYVGAIGGEPSEVFLAVAPGQVNGFLRDGAGRTLILSTGDPRAPAGILTIADSALIVSDDDAKPWTCRVLDERVPPPDHPVPAGAGSPGPQVRVADMFVDGDHDFRALFPTAEDAVDYLVTLWTVAGYIYRRDIGVAFRLPDGYVRVWEVVPPWGDNGAFGVDEYQAYWQSDENPLQDLPRAAAHVVTSPIAGGVAAAFGGVCSFEAGYASSSVQGFFPIPLPHTSADNWDPFVITHEYGHIFGSTHTQDYVPPIACNDGSGPDNGTIMSYCHQQPGGVVNIGMRFHARCQHAIRAFADARDCFEVVGHEPGDFDYDGDLDEDDLLSCQVCVNQGFEAIGCLETFDLDGDGALTSCDFSVLEAIVDPMKQPNDCNGNSVPDTCEDCNGNGLADECDIAGGASTDCDGDGIADECQALFDGDCDGNGSPDYCDIVAGAPDTDSNGVPDACQSVLNVPSASYPTIQSAIDAAGPGDVVLLQAGVFSGPGNRDLDFQGRNLTVRGGGGGAEACIINAQGLGRGFIFQSGESPATRVESLTIIGSLAPLGAAVLCQAASSPTLVDLIITINGSMASTGGGIACIEASEPTLVGCTIANNLAGTGGAVYCQQSSPEVRECIIDGNHATEAGGGIACVSANPLIRRCLIESNSATDGGGVSCTIGSEPVFEACTFSANSALTRGGGIYAVTSHPRVQDCLLHANAAGSGGGLAARISSSPSIVNCTFIENEAGDASSHDARFQSGSAALSNCILWGSAPGTRVGVSSSSATYLDHCVVKDGILGISAGSPDALVWGPGNLDKDPLFTDPDAGDFSLTAGSPAIDAGDPAFVPEPGQTDLDGGPRRVDGDGDGTPFVDIGADERPCLADLDGDGATGIVDLLSLLAAWGPNANHAADLDGDGTVGITDLLLLLAAWGGCT